MIAVKEKKIATMLSSLFVLLVLTGSSCAFISSNSKFTTSTRYDTSIGVGNILGLFDEGKKKLVKSLAGEYDAAAIQDRVNKLIDDNPVLMFSFTTWPFCVKAKDLLDDMNVKYTVVELDTDPDGKAIRAEMADIVGRTSVPAIWIGKQFIGGCNDGPLGGLITLNESGKLNWMLSEVGAV